MKTLLMIFLGGGTGSVLRYLISFWCRGLTDATHFPVGTLLCNVAGCFMIGMFNGFASAMGWSSDTRLMLTVGLCGGFTTFSTFSNEGLAMLNSGDYMMYALYVCLSVIMGLLAVFVGANAFS